MGEPYTLTVCEQPAEVATDVSDSRPCEICGGASGCFQTADFVVCLLRSVDYDNRLGDFVPSQIIDDRGDGHRFPRHGGGR